MYIKHALGTLLIYYGYKLNEGWRQLENIVEIHNLGMKYQSLNGEINAIQNINLFVKKGEFISIVGPSGCGKSTLLSIISGLLTPTSGEIIINGRQVSGTSYEVGYMLQKDHLFDWRTILENVLLGLEIRKVKMRKLAILLTQITLLIVIFAAWEIAANLKIIDSFITSQPSRIVKTITNLYREGQLFGHIGITCLETIVGFVLGTAFGTIIAIILWWSEFLAKVMEPYLVVLNSLPKIALGPIFIVWIGAGPASILKIETVKPQLFSMIINKEIFIN